MADWFAGGKEPAMLPCHCLWAGLCHGLSFHDHSLPLSDSGGVRGDMIQKVSASSSILPAFHCRRTNETFQWPEYRNSESASQHWMTFLLLPIRAYHEVHNVCIGRCVYELLEFAQATSLTDDAMQLHAMLRETNSINDTLKKRVEKFPL